MYKVIKHFTDLQDHNHPYNPGDTFPRAGLKVDAERFAELASENNKQGVLLIQIVEETPKKAATAKAKKTAAK